MSIRTLVIWLIVAATALFAILNWEAFIAPTSLSFGVTQVQAPLGLIMLGVSVFLLAVFLLYAFYLQATVLLETRRHNKEMREQRKLADLAEASRFAELQQFLEGELNKLASAHSASTATLLERMAATEDALRQSIDQATNSLSASVGELEDRLDKGDGSLQPRPD